MKKIKLRLILLLTLVILTRVPYLVNQSIPFSFDHGRDMVAALEVVKTGSLRFVGPWTSIPGLFFGSAWYYFLSLVLLISQHPVAPVWGMLVLGLGQIVIAYRWFGFWEAVLVATAPVWGIMSIGASNAFPMSLATWLVLVMLKLITEKKSVNWKWFFWLGVFMSLGFHFSSALAVFYLLIVPLVLIVNRVKIDWKKLGAGVGGFLIPFIPQLLFEVKNKFIQTKGLMNYFAEGTKRGIKLNTIEYYAKAVLHELGLGVLPEGGKITYLGLGLLAIGLGWVIIRKKKIKYLKESLIFILIPILGFSIIHFNAWYAYGLLPIAVILTAQILRNSPKLVQGFYLILLLLTPLLGLRRYYTETKAVIDKGKAFLPIKLEALEYIYEQAGDKPFKSYQYMGEIYDYDWQYLYLWQGFKGRQLPVEFTYKPGEVSYVVEKAGLLAKLPKAEGTAEKTFLIISLPENKHHYPLESWLDQFGIKEVVSKKQLSDEMEVWEVTVN